MSGGIDGRVQVAISRREIAWGVFTGLWWFMVSLVAVSAVALLGGLALALAIGRSITT